jgi:hypothetical protein
VKGKKISVDLFQRELVRELAVVNGCYPNLVPYVTPSRLDERFAMQPAARSTWQHSRRGQSSRSQKFFSFLFASVMSSCYGMQVLAWLGIRGGLSACSPSDTGVERGSNSARARRVKQERRASADLSDRKATCAVPTPGQFV